MKRFFAVSLILGALCFNANVWGGNEFELVSRAIKRKFSRVAEKAPLDETHPAILAAHQISDPATQQTVLEMCHSFQEELNLVIGCLKHEAPNPGELLSAWGSLNSHDRPLLTSGKLWKQEVVKIDQLEAYLAQQWNGSPLVVADEYHLAALKLQIDEETKRIVAHFYDPYEAFSAGSYLERRVLEVLEYKAFPEYQVEWYAHYPKHQKLSAFGECSLYASVYRRFLLKGQDPDRVDAAEVLKNVSLLKEMIREQFPDYFQDYDRIFQFSFDTGFAAYLLEEIRKLPSDWGIESE